MTDGKSKKATLFICLSLNHSVSIIIIIIIITPKAVHKIQYNLKVHWYNKCKDKNTHTDTHTYME